MMVFPNLFWILAVVSAVLCSIGFYRFVWFMSVGYGLAVAGCGAALLIAGLIGGNFSIPYLLLCILLVIYGCRLGLFLLIREMKNAAYKKTLDAQTKPVPIFVKVVMWLMMALLYPMQVSPVMYRSCKRRCLRCLRVDRCGNYPDRCCDGSRCRQAEIRCQKN